MIKVAVRLPVAIDNVGEFLADVRALEAAGADTLWIEPGEWDEGVLLGAVAAITHRMKIGCSSADSLETLQRLSRGRMVGAESPGETWRSVDVPSGRESWIALLKDSEADGATGVIVPWDPRLIDLLRNSEPDDRSDLLMSVG